MGRPKGSKNTLESRQRMSEARTGEGNSFYGKHHTVEFKQKRCNEGNPMFGRHHSLESRQSIGGKLKQKWTKPEFRDSMTQSFQEHGNGVSTRFTSESMKKRYQDPEYLKRRQEFLHTSPNQSEQILRQIIKSLDLQYTYTGNGSFWIEGKNPDFVNTNGQKKIIELLGCYWHGCKQCYSNPDKGNDLDERVQLFKSFGYSTLDIWEHELKDIETVKCKILEFDRVGV